MWVVHGGSPLTGDQCFVHHRYFGTWCFTINKIGSIYNKNYLPYLNHVCPANKKGDVIFPTQTAAIKFRSISAKIYYYRKFSIATSSHEPSPFQTKKQGFFHLKNNSWDLSYTTTTWPSCVSGQLSTYPSPKPTLTLTSHLRQNDGLGEG